MEKSRGSGIVDWNLDEDGANLAEFDDDDAGATVNRLSWLDTPQLYPPLPLYPWLMSPKSFPKSVLVLAVEFGHIHEADEAGVASDVSEAQLVNAAAHTDSDDEEEL